MAVVVPVAEPKELTAEQAVQESVAAPTFPFWGSYVNTLPPWSDDLEQDFGFDIYERMLFDPQVESSFGILMMGVLSDGIQVTAAIKEGEQGHDEADEIASFCRRNLDRLCPDLLTATLPDLLLGIAYGHRIAERVMEYAPDGPDKGKLVLKSLKVKPRRALSFVVDSFMNVLGLLNQTSPKGVLFNASDPERLLPREKFVIFTWKQRASDPRGNSGFRCIYDAWWRKYQTIGEWLKYIVQFGSGSLVAVLGPNARKMMELDAEGNPVLDGNGQPNILDPIALTLAALQAIRNGSVGVFPNGTAVEKLEMDGEGEAFVTALDRCDREIERGITYQVLATSEAKHQARASSEVHQDTKGTVVKFIKAALASVIQRDVLMPLVEFNFGREKLPLVPSVSFGDTEQQDIAKMLTALGGLGYELHPTQFQELDARNGVPRRSDEAVVEAVEAKKAPPPMPGGPPGQPGAKPKPGAKPADDKKDDT